MQIGRRLPAFLFLLLPKVRAKLNRTRGDDGASLKFGVLGAMAVVFWVGIFAMIHRMLLYFRGTEGIGDLLAAKLLGLALLTFLLILLLSNIITALSTFFLAKDVELLVASPIDPLHVYWARLCESLANSSWMVLLLMVPLVGAYAAVYGASLSFYLLTAAVVLPFLVLPAVAGSALTLILVNVFPARRTRDLLALVGLLAAAGVVVLVRFLQPERLVRPDEFRSLVDFMAALRTPTSPWLPSEWASSALMTHLGGSFEPFPFLLLVSTAAAFLVVGGWLHLRYFPEGFSRAQEGAEKKEGRTRSRAWERLLRPADLRTRELVAKEVRVFFRDTTQWSQLILLGVLIVVYIYNIQVLPLTTSDDLSFFLVNVVSFLNLGLAGFVVAAIAARFIFPAMSLEGRMMWLLRSSPLDPRRIFWVKYWVGTVPLLLIAIPLIVATNLILEVSTFMLVVSTVTMAGATFAITALALGFGALYPNFDTENPAEIPTSFGGLLFMMAAVGYLALVAVFEGWPVYLFLQARLQGATLGEAGIFPLVLGFGSVAVVTALAITIPLRIGIRSVRSSDF